MTDRETAILEKIRAHAPLTDEEATEYYGKPIGEQSHLEDVLDELDMKSINFESVTLTHDDAGMLYDYVCELRDRIETLEAKIGNGASALED